MRLLGPAKCSADDDCSDGLAFEPRTSKPQPGDRRARLSAVSLRHTNVRLLGIGRATLIAISSSFQGELSSIADVARAPCVIMNLKSSIRK